MRKHSIIAIGMILAAISTASARSGSENAEALQTGRSVAVDRIERATTAAINPSDGGEVDGTGYFGQGTATGGPVGGLPGRN